MVGTDEELRLSLVAEPASIGFARRAVSELAAGLGMEEPALGDLKTIVSEACSNVVRHAYSGEEGNLDVEAFPEQSNLIVVVRDFGQGMRPRVEARHGSLRLGLGLISSLSGHFEISGGDGGGTEVRMQVPLPDQPSRLN